MAYWFLDSLLGAVKPHDVITPVYMFVSGCVAAAFAKVKDVKFIFSRTAHDCQILDNIPPQFVCCPMLSFKSAVRLNV